MEYQTLEKTSTFWLYQTFMKAFSDYQVTVEMPYEAFETNLKRNGYMPDVSVGAFEHEELVGIVLNGVRCWDGVKTIYDLGTGVIPAFRKRGITKEMLNMVQAICQDKGIGRYQLEVIQENTAAVSLYKVDDPPKIAGRYTLCDIFDHSPVFRVGGDEFVVFLRGDDYSNRDKLMQTLQAQVRDNLQSKSGPVLASGMAVFTPEKDCLVTEILNRADKAMYKNKRDLKK